MFVFIRGGDMDLHADGWRVLGTDLVAWFDAPSHAAGAELVDRIVSEDTDIDLRPGGIRVTAGPQAAQRVSAAATELGLTADPSRLQRTALIIDAADETTVAHFWRTALGYEPAGDGRLRDPLRRDPDWTIRQRDDPRPLRNRTHIDIVRPAAAVEAVRAGLGREPYGAYGLTIADDEGNETDVVPGGQLTADWRTVFSAMVCYPTSSPEQTAELVTTVAGLADGSGVPMMIDVRAGRVVIDSGKDGWEGDDAPDERFLELAGRVETVANRLGLAADHEPLRFVQFAIDAVDVPAVQAFWMSVLDYRHDPRPFLTDIFDRHRLGPVLMFQEMDATDEERRRQRNRIHLELTVPDDRLDARVQTALAAGGRLLDESPGRRTVADPEGLELTIAGTGRTREVARRATPDVGAVP